MAHFQRDLSYRYAPIAQPNVFRPSESRDPVPHNPPHQYPVPGDIAVQQCLPYRHGVATMRPRTVLCLWIIDNHIISLPLQSICPPNGRAHLLGGGPGAIPVHGHGLLNDSFATETPTYANPEYVIECFDTLNSNPRMIRCPWIRHIPFQYSYIAQSDLADIQRSVCSRLCPCPDSQSIQTQSQLSALAVPFVPQSRTQRTQYDPSSSSSSSTTTARPSNAPQYNSSSTPTAAATNAPDIPFNTHNIIQACIKAVTFWRRVEPELTEYEAKLLRVIDLPQPAQEIHYVDEDGNDQVVAMPPYEWDSIEHQEALESIWKKSVPILKEIFPTMTSMNALDYIVDDLGLSTPLTNGAVIHSETQLASPIDELVKPESSVIGKDTGLEYVNRSQFRASGKL